MLLYRVSTNESEFHIISELRKDELEKQYRKVVSQGRVTDAVVSSDRVYFSYYGSRRFLNVSKFIKEIK